MSCRVKCESCSLVVVNGVPCHEQGCPNPVTIYTDTRGRVFLRFTLRSYDTWGNPKDGFEVNDTHQTGVSVLLPDDCGQKEVVQALKKAGWLNKRLHMKSIEIEWPDEYTCELTWAKTGEPLGRLEARQW